MRKIVGKWVGAHFVHLIIVTSYGFNSFDSFGISSFEYFEMLNALLVLPHGSVTDRGKKHTYVNNSIADSMEFSINIEPLTSIDLLRVPNRNNIASFVFKICHFQIARILPTAYATENRTICFSQPEYKVANWLKRKIDRQEGWRPCLRLESTGRNC